MQRSVWAMIGEAIAIALLAVSTWWLRRRP